MKKCLTQWKKASLKERVEVVAQVLLYVLIAPRAFSFFFGTSFQSGMSLRSFLLGLLVVALFAGIYVAAIKISEKTSSQERWALFLLSIILISLPLAIAGKVSKKLKNEWASMLLAGATVIVGQFLMSVVFTAWLILIEFIAF